MPKIHKIPTKVANKDIENQHNGKTSEHNDIVRWQESTVGLLSDEAWLAKIKNRGPSTRTVQKD